MTAFRFALAAAFVVSGLAALPAAAQNQNPDQDTSQGSGQGTQKSTTPGKKGDKFTQNEVVVAASNFFGATTEAVAKAVQHVFADNGLPDAYIKGDEGSGAFIVGLRYGAGWLIRKGYEPVRVYWQGPSVGFDFGGNASKAFILVYNLKSEDRIFQKFPGAEGTFYFVAGIGVNYLRSGGITLAPMRTGVGLRAGVNAGYLTFTRHESLNPF